MSPDVQRLGFLPATAMLTRYYQAAGEPLLAVHLADGASHLVTPTVLGQLRALYDSNVRAGDGAFGRIVEALARRGIAPRTVVVLGADHGESLGEHAWFGHNRLWQSVLHTPLVVHVPGTPHRTIGEPVMNVDILPTVARLVGAPLVTPVRGHDLFEPRGADGVQYAEYSSAYVVIQRPWKIRIAGGHGPFAPPHAEGLWDLVRDPGEDQNVLPKHPDVAAYLTGIGQELRRRTLASGTAPPGGDLRERLRQLGYIAPDAPLDD
jgi:arylsulfatase A-like enzyme